MGVIGQVQSRREPSSAYRSGSRCTECTQAVRGLFWDVVEGGRDHTSSRTTNVSGCEAASHVGMRFKESSVLGVPQVTEADCRIVRYTSCIETHQVAVRLQQRESAMTRAQISVTHLAMAEQILVVQPRALRGH